MSAAAFFGQGFVPGTLREAAWQVTIRLQFLRQWDNEGIERQTVLDLFDAFGTKEKALHGNLRGHTGTHGSRASRSDNWNLRGPAPKASSATTPTPTPDRRRGITGTSQCRQLAINRSMKGEPNRVREPGALFPTRPSNRVSAPAVAPPATVRATGREERPCYLRST